MNDAPDPDDARTDDDFIDPSDFAAEVAREPSPSSGRPFHRPPRKPDDYLVYSILVSLFCCQPLGIVAIVFSAMTMAANNTGDYQAAQKHARLANQFNAWASGSDWRTSHWSS